MADRAFRGTQLLAALQGALEELRRWCAEVNALNVFPVADHDTGTNLCATFAAAVEAARAAPAGELGPVAEAASRGAFLGARGSSGAILAEYLHGLSVAWRGLREATGEQVASALRAAARAAREAVQSPVEGTVLTVADALASEASSAPVEDPAAVLQRAAGAARATWARTPRMLAVLRRAGVVDAGAAGVVALVEAMAAAAAGVPHPPLAPPAPTAPPPAVLALDARPRYCTELLVQVDRVSPAQVRRALAKLGDALVVATRDAKLRVHLHTHAPDRVLARALRWGQVEHLRAVRLPRQPPSEGACPDPGD